MDSCRRLRVFSAPGQVQVLQRVSQAPPRVLSDGVRPRLGLVQCWPRHVSRDSEVRPFRPLGGWDVRLIAPPVHPRVTSSGFDVELHVPGRLNPWAPLRRAPRRVGCGSRAMCSGVADLFHSEDEHLVSRRPDLSGPRTPSACPRSICARFRCRLDGLGLPAHIVVHRSRFRL